MYHISSHIIRIGKLGVNSWVNALCRCLHRSWHLPSAGDADTTDSLQAIGEIGCHTSSAADLAQTV